jgi:hypothetical protein
VVILVICFGQFFESLRINAILDVRTIDAKKDNLPAALDRDLGIWTGGTSSSFAFGNAAAGISLA